MCRLEFPGLFVLESAMASALNLRQTGVTLQVSFTVPQKPCTHESNKHNNIDNSRSGKPANAACESYASVRHCSLLLLIAFECN